MAEWMKKDPIPTFREKLLKDKTASENEVKAVEDGIRQVLDEAVAFATQAPVPQVEEALAGVYADTHNGLVF
jgi:pyruvate dehydrogenase E1 component alpha subunit